jgi:chromosomal replication initiation ATPase DnaA
MTPADIARTILGTYPENSIDIALEVVRILSRQNALDAADAVCGKRERHSTTGSFDAIVAAVCSHYGVTYEQLHADSRAHVCVKPRQMCWALLRERLGLAFEEIAVRWSKHHTTVIDGCGRVNRNSTDWLQLNRRLDAACVFAEAAE